MTNRIIINPPSFKHGSNIVSIHNLDLSSLAKILWTRTINKLSIYWTDGNSYFETHLQKPCSWTDVVGDPGNNMVKIISVLMEVEGKILIDSNLEDETYFTFHPQLNHQDVKDKILNLELPISCNKQLFSDRVLNRDCFKTIVLED